MLNELNVILIFSAIGIVLIYFAISLAIENINFINKKNESLRRSFNKAKKENQINK